MRHLRSYPSASSSKQWGGVTGTTAAPLAADPYIVLPGARLEEGGGKLYETMGADVEYAPRQRGGVQTLMHVGHDGLGQLGPDLSATARTVGWGGAAVWAYAKFIKKDKALEEKAMYFAIGGFAGSVLL